VSGANGVRCAVVGAGAWGTALADLLARNGHDTVLWARESDVVDGVNARGENARFLEGVALARSLRATADVREAVRDRDLVLLAPPSHVLRAVTASAVEALPPAATLAVASKGIERETLAVMTDVVADVAPGGRWWPCRGRASRSRSPAANPRRSSRPAPTRVRRRSRRRR
jgi:glycerol-3-phosphate dehydrogenase (NAD(P)+)